ncbi:sel1 repeat family protein [Actinomadura citrea]|uniref:Sel1 repeat family protein n=1 Tax=Actinomadura citrea TaxID=46158 RepID=A0A7Y9KHQ7_9ACTN|nr:sel1 repeat family protein [Actinomadura citrea]NYE17950.1 hypothetical protein [Actinomadura citrea]GGT62621.1 hypothetical protein GCM10010177_19550 [Actinomadura citrea]
MEHQQHAEWIPREQTRLVGALLEESGVAQKVISGRSREVAVAYRLLCPDLPGGLDPSTVSRMKTGSDLRKLKRCNLRLLHLTIAYVKSPRGEERAVSVGAVEEANDFADAVLRAGGAVEELKPSCFNPNDPRHDRAAGLFGEYGISLLERAIAQDDERSLRKIAVLQWLSGNIDDARYWNGRAGKMASGTPEALDAEVAAYEAYSSGRSYLYKGQRGIAEIYLALAADAGHRDAAFLLGDALEELQRNEEARRWFSTAQSNGHGEAGKRLSALEEGSLEGDLLDLCGDIDEGVLAEVDDTDSVSVIGADAAASYRRQML